MLKCGMQSALGLATLRLIAAPRHPGGLAARSFAVSEENLTFSEFVARTPLGADMRSAATGVPLAVRTPAGEVVGFGAFPELSSRSPAATQEGEIQCRPC